ncbi:MAG: hypothetical protein LBV08_04685 [Clostridiales bacterium]|jgi:hypothetical protein|nr:hypothetical protein [Clostridiales bacterium]
MKGKTLVKILIYSINIFIFALFCYWYLANDSTVLFPSVFSTINVIVICTIINKLSGSLEEAWHLGLDEGSERYFYPETPERGYYVKVVAVSAVFFVLLSAILLIRIKSTYPNTGLNEAIKGYYSSMLDAEKYIYLSNNWYASVVDDFDNYKSIYPLYLILIKPFAGTNFNYLVQIFINIILSVLSCIFLFNVAVFDYDEEAAFKAVLFLLLLPISFFLISPLPIALLLLLSLIYIYFVRRHEWWYSAIAGYFAGLTHPIALALMVFGFIEYIAYAREELSDVLAVDSVNLDKSPLFYISDKDNYKFYIPYVLKGFSVLSILVAYIFFVFMNRRVYVDEANIFLVFNDIFDLDGPYFFSNAFFLIGDFEESIAGSGKAALSEYLPTVLFMLASLAILFKNYNKMRASYLVYSVSMYVFLFSAENILSQTKYMVLLFPMAFVFALISEKRLFFIILVAVSSIAFIAYYGLFILGYPIS